MTKQSKIVLPNREAVCFDDQVTEPGTRYTARGTVFKKRGRIPAQDRVLWGSKVQDRCTLVTNAPNLSGREYAKRIWMEEAFGDLKSHGWQVEQTHFTDPNRMARSWILLVVTYARVDRGSGGRRWDARQRWQLPAAVECFSGGSPSLFVGFPSHLTLLSPLNHCIERGEVHAIFIRQTASHPSIPLA